MEDDQKLFNEANEKIENEPAWTWYKKGGKIDFDAKTRSEVFADAIIKNENGLTKLFAIPKITRIDDYIMTSHREIAKKNLENKQIVSLSEPLICQNLFLLGTKKPYEKIGWIIDFETPLYDGTEDKNKYQIDGIDLVSYDKEHKTILLLEAKRPKTQGSQDNSLLRAVLEVFTYWKFLDHQKLLYDISRSQRAEELRLANHLKENLYEISVKKAVLLFEDSRAYNEYIDGYDSDPSKCSFTVQLMKKLGVDFYGIKPFGDNYEVFDPSEKK